MIQTLHKSDLFGPDNFPITIARREPQPEFPRHKHEFSELVIITGGEGIHSIRNENYPVTAGDVFVITDQSPHEYNNMANLKLVNILFDPSALKMQTWDIRTLPGYHAMFKLEPTYRRRHKFKSSLHLNKNELQTVIHLADKLEHELNQRAPGFRLMATAFFMELVAHLSRKFGSQGKDVTRSLIRIGETISHIEEHYSDEITLGSLADMAHMSPRNLTRIFNEVVGMSPVDYLINVRITRAVHLLKNSERTITDIAFACGFSDSNYFSRQFRKIMHCPPAAYRSGLLPSNAHRVRPRNEKSALRDPPFRPVHPLFRYVDSPPCSF